MLRAGQGSVRLFAIIREIFTGDVVFAEAEAILKGIELAKEVGFHRLIIESDSLNAVNLVNGKLTSRLGIELVVYVPGTCNLVAHNLAKLALSVDKPYTLQENVPIDLVNLL